MIVRYLMILISSLLKMKWRDFVSDLPPVVVGLKFIYGLLLVADQQLALASCNIIYIGSTLVSDPS